MAACEAELRTRERSGRSGATIRMLVGIGDFGPADPEAAADSRFVCGRKDDRVGRGKRKLFSDQPQNAYRPQEHAIRSIRDWVIGLVGAVESEISNFGRLGELVAGGNSRIPPRAHRLMNYVSDLGVENVMKRKSLKSAECPIARALDEIGDWWTLLIVGEAVQGVCRFNDFQRRIGIAKNILSVRLRRLVEDDILYVQRSSERTERGEYHLTVKGRQLQIILLALWQWGAENLYDEGEPMSLMVDMIDGKLLKPLELR